MSQEPAANHLSVSFLSSGSSGNCTLVQDATDAFIIDFGLRPELLVASLRARHIPVQYWREKPRGKATPAPVETEHAGPRLAAAVLTHLHGDHVSLSSLRLLLENNVRLFVHTSHLPELEENKTFQKMCDRGLVESFDKCDFSLTSNMHATPLKLPHDFVQTCGFVFSRVTADTTRKFSYLADLGHFPSGLEQVLANSDLLALEFNHDVSMERNSGRHPRHIARVLGPHGHLSNEQASDALKKILSHSRTTRPRFLALLHVSRQCNTLKLATESASNVLSAMSPETEIVPTRHREYAGTFYVDPNAAPTKPLPKATANSTASMEANAARIYDQPTLFNDIDV